MEPAERLAIETLWSLMAFNRIEETRLRTIIAHSESRERRQQTLVELGHLLIKMGIQSEELAKLEERTGKSE